MAKLPLPGSCTVSDSVCGPTAQALVSQLYVCVDAALVAVKTVMPSIFSVQVIVPPPVSARSIPTVTMPLTVAPSAGLEMRGLGPGITFETAA